MRNIGPILTVPHCAACVLSMMLAALPAAVPAQAGSPAPPSVDPGAVSESPDLAQITGNIDQRFLALLLGQSQNVLGDLLLIDSVWQRSLLPMALEVMVFSRNRAVVEGLIAVMQSKTGQTFGMDIDAWYRWIWSQPEQRHPHYARFKSQLYKNIDPRFEF